MPQFTVRVELHEAKWGDYDTLHAAMAKKGFSRVIVADDRRTFHLPWAEYDGAADRGGPAKRDSFSRSDKWSSAV